MYIILYIIYQKKRKNIEDGRSYKEENKKCHGPNKK